MIKYNFKELTGDVVTRDDFRYEESRMSWNRAIEKYPLVIIYCKEKNDVRNSILWARKNELPIRIRSGCHNYEGYSTGNDVVVIDVSKMNNIYIDENKGKVKIEGGVRNRELYEATGSKGYPFPGGGCPTVGVPGLVLGGGWGYSTRLLGLSCDSLVELELIDYMGNLIIANERENSDLFWACRGAGGGNFGVVVSMTFNIPKKIDMVTLINMDFPNIDLEEKIEFMKMWQNEYKNLDRRANFKLGIYNSETKGKGIKLTGLFYGDKEEAKKIVEPFKKIPSFGEFSLDYTTVLDANRKIQDSHPDYEKYKSSGRFVSRDYSEKEIKEIIALVDDRAEGAYYAAVSFYGLGGAVRDKSSEDTAFAFRNSNFIIGFQSVWEDPKYAPANRAWVVDKFKNIIEMTEGSFINFPYAELEDYEREYFGTHTNRLREIKKKYDPQNIFGFPQGISIKK